MTSGHLGNYTTLTDVTETKTIMIDATYLKAHRTASSLAVKKGGARDR